MLSEEKVELIRRHLDVEGVASVYLYGSYAQGVEHEDSDIDIGFLLLEDGDFFDFSEVSRMERDLTRELGEKVDLRVLNGGDTRFLYNVLRNGESILVRDEEARKDFEYSVLRNYLDMKPFFDEYDSKVRERLSA